jgi:PAS domain S-box-containing protein
MSSSNDNLRFDALFYHAAIGIVMVNRESDILLANHFAELIFGYEKNELIGQKIEVLLPESIRQAHVQHHEGYVKSPKIRPMGTGLNLQSRRKDGSHFPVEVSLSFFEQSGENYFLAFINDVTFKKQAEQELIDQKEKIEILNQNLEQEVVSRTKALVETLKTLEESKQELEISLSKERELGELKSRFVSMASHEFRTPLSTILSAATLIEKYPHAEDQEKREKHIKRIKAAVGNLTDILEEFLSVGKIEEGKIEVRNVSFDLPDLIHEIIYDFKNILKVGQLVRYNHHGQEDIVLDKSLLRKIIINLCSNATKFSPENSTIEISTICTKNQLFLTIKDYGIGISEEDQKHLFERFFRAGNVINVQGTGLGLHIVAKYTELMQGEVSLKSKLEEGTEIAIIFQLND